MKELIPMADIVGIGETTSLVTMSAIKSDTWMPGKIQTEVVGGNAVKLKAWGKDNNEPDMRELLVSQNNIIPALIKTKRDIVLGSGIMTYTEEWIDGVRNIKEIPIPDKMKEGLKNFTGDELMRAARELEFHGQVFIEYIRDRAGRIVSHQVKRCRTVRLAQVSDNDRIETGYIKAKWGKVQSGEEKIKPAVAVPLKNGDKQPKFLARYGSDILGDDYYYSPFWWGGRKWIELANCIPDFHLANLKHGYSIRYHIEIPFDYFSSSGSADQIQEGEDTQVADNRAYGEFVRKLDGFLSGAEKSGRTLVTRYEMNTALGKEFPGIKITPLSVDLQDEALIKLFDKSNEANVSAQAIHPTLANIQTQGKLSSGSEIRNAYLMYLAISVPTSRRILLDILQPYYESNGWDPAIKVGFRDLELTSLDENPNGSQPMTMTPQ